MFAAVILLLATTVSTTYASLGGTLDVQNIVLQGDTGRYLSRIRRGGVDAIEVAKPNIDQFCVFKVIKLSDCEYAFRADNGKYLSRIRRNGRDAIEAAKTTIDEYCRFKVSKFAPGVITLLADNNKFWSRINRGSINPVEAAKVIADQYSRFKVVRVDVVGRSYD